jgi:hypothetical protein
MTRLGFRVKELIGGLDWWKRDGHKTAAAQPALAPPPAAANNAYPPDGAV